MNKILLLSFLTLELLTATAILAQQDKLVKLSLKEGDHFHVRVSEVLYIRQQFSQVDSEMAEPAWRTTVYDFTEAVEKINPDGSAQMASSLDSLTTIIYVKDQNERNEFFRFNSNNEYDLKSRLHDIRALPRAQFLGQTLRYRLSPDGLVMSFDNLGGFRDNTIARSFDYDMFHAMMSLSDSLRIGQLLEHGFGAVAAMSGNNKGMMHSPYTLTEIPVTRNLNAKMTGENIHYNITFTDIPDSTQYLEGIAFPMNIQKFLGSAIGDVTFKNGMATSGNSHDTASFELHVDGDIIKEQIARKASFTREPIALLRGNTVNIKEISTHHTPPKVPELEDLQPLKPNQNSGSVQDSTRHK
ncbi:MAG: hypothetical protein WCH46_10770 [bacterium]